MIEENGIIFIITAFVEPIGICRAMVGGIA